MTNVDGVIILLEPNTRILPFIHSSVSRLEVSSVSLGKRCVDQLTIGPICDVGFVPGGAVAISFFEDQDVRVVFDPGSVLEIRYLTGDLLVRNRSLCLDCGELTGTVVEEELGSIAGCCNRAFSCIFCGRRWQLNNI